ncbi:MAG TPA: SH3 domain-containing protein, partial [Chloroflexaceae bacterium]|nr:SH3 domain-containing protein [Chloroflexaceae bacterium]
APLRAREAPGLQAPIVARIPEGSEVTLRDGPAEADGYTWWQVEAEGAAGWVAAGSPEGVVFLEVVP